MLRAAGPERSWQVDHRRACSARSCGPRPGARGRAASTSVTEPREVRRRIGFAMQEVGVDAFATACELLVLQGRLHGLVAAEAVAGRRLLLAMVDLGDAADKRLGDFSGGMQRRVDLAASLMHLPAGRVPGRADRGPRPARSRGDLGRARPAASSVWASRSSSPPTTWRRPIGCATGSDHRPRPALWSRALRRTQGARSAAIRSRTSTCTTRAHVRAATALPSWSRRHERPASLLLAARTIVQFPRNPILLGFSFAPVLMMFLVFGALFEGVTQPAGLPDRQLLRVPRADGDPAHHRAGHRQRRGGARLGLPEPLRLQAPDRADLDRLDRARPAARRRRATVRAGRWPSCCSRSRLARTSRRASLAPR